MTVNGFGIDHGISKGLPGLTGLRTAKKVRGAFRITDAKKPKSDHLNRTTAVGVSAGVAGGAAVGDAERRHYNKLGAGVKAGEQYKHPVKTTRRYKEVGKAMAHGKTCTCDRCKAKYSDVVKGIGSMVKEATAIVPSTTPTKLGAVKNALKPLAGPVAAGAVGGAAVGATTGKVKKSGLPKIASGLREVGAGAREVAGPARKSARKATPFAVAGASGAVAGSAASRRAGASRSARRTYGAGW